MAPVTAFAHFSDPHLPLRTGLPRPVRLLAGKRLLGYVSWRCNRRMRHCPDALRALIDDIAAHGPNHILITGDLVNIALPEEFVAARRWLDTLGAPRDVSVVPGNHDAAVPVPWPFGLGRWEPWMTGDAGPDAQPRPEATWFPFVRVRGDIAFVGLSSAAATGPFMANGKLGADQVERAARQLKDLGRAGLFRVVGVHHPPVDGILGKRKALSDRTALQEVLAIVGAELVVHGHCHRPHFAHLPGPRGAVPVVGVPSASALPAADGRHARWHLFRVARTNQGWRLSMTARGLTRNGTFTTEGGWTMTLPGYGNASVGAEPGPLVPTLPE